MAKLPKSSASKPAGLALLVLLLSPAPRLFAEQPLELETLVVTAGLQPLSIREVAASVTVITREEIEQKQVLYLADLLRDIPGFAVSQAGGPGSQTQVRVRGAEANQLLVLVDGVRANDPAASDEFQYQFALSSDIERIEIIRGPQSATWGSDAVAGVINIIRRKAAGGRQLTGRVETGSFNTLSATLGGGYAGAAVRVNGGLSHLQTDGTNISRTGGEADGAENTSGRIAAELDIAGGFSLELSGQVTDASSDYDDIDYFVTGLPVDADRVTESRQTYLLGKLRFEPPQSPWSGSASVSRTRSDYDNLSDGAWTGSTGAETIGARLRAGAVFGGKRSHHLRFSLETEGVDFSQRGEATFYGDPNQDRSYRANGYALQYVGKPSPALTWSAGARRDDYSDFDDATTWQLAGSYQLSKVMRLRGSAGTGIKAPTFVERYGYYGDFFIGNPGLKPESSKGWEIGLDADWAARGLRFQMAYFDQDLKDEIDGFVFDPDSFMFTARNKDTDSHRQGVEVVLDARMGASLAFRASYSYTDATEEDALGEQLAEVRRPKHLASAMANYAFAGQRGNLNLALTYNGSQLDNFFSPVSYLSERVRIDAYTVLHLAASWRLAKSLELTGRISNLLDEDYEEILGFARPGRAAYLGLRGGFGY